MSLTHPAGLAVVMQATGSARSKAESWHSAFSRVEGDLTTAVQQRLARQFSCSTRSVRRQHATWVQGGRMPSALIDRRLSPDRSTASLNPEFVEWWKSLCDQNARKIAPAYRRFLREWRAGNPIPGIPALAHRSQMPPFGFSLANLRRHAPTPFELKTVRIGRSAAADCRPLVFTTRVGMEVGHEYMFDDMWHDFSVVVLGQRRPSRLLQLHAHDVFSACQFARGLKPRAEDPETGRSVNLDGGDMLFHFAHVLGAHGYHPDGTRLTLENGTATADDATVALLSDLTGGKIRCQFADIQSASGWAGQYAGRGKGNFRMKAALESSHNLIHNETADLIEFPGQAGSNSRLNEPEQLHGQKHALDVLQRAITRLPEHVVRELRLPFIEASKAVWLVTQVQEWINERTDHDLEGWIEAGLTVMEYLLPGEIRVPASKVMELSADKRAAIEAVAQPLPRRMSPREVWEQGRRRLIRLRPEQTARLLVGVCGREVTVGANHLVVFEDASISPSPLRYLAHTLSPGDKFRSVCNPFDPSVLHLFDAGERWQGAIKLWQAVPRTDDAAIKARIAEASEIAGQLLQPLARRDTRQAQRRLEDLEHNNEVIRRQQRGEQDLGAAADAALSRMF